MYLTQSSFSPGQPLPVYLELEQEVRTHEGAPNGRVERLRHEGWGSTDGKEHADDPRGKEEVDTNRVKVLSLDGFEVEDALENVSEGNSEEGGGGEEPNSKIEEWRDVEEGGGGAGR